MIYAATIKKDGGLVGGNVLSYGPDYLTATDLKPTAGLDPLIAIGTDGSFSLDVPANGYVRILLDNGDEVVLDPSSLRPEVLEITTPDGYTVTRKKEMNLVPVLAVGTLLFLATRQQGRKVSGFDPNIAVGVVIIGGAAFILYKLSTGADSVLQAVGLEKSGQTKEVDKLLSAESPWAPSYWQTINPSGTNWTDAITDTQAKDYAAQLYNCFSLLHPQGGDVPFSVIRSLHTKANLSYISYWFNQQYNQDLLKYIRGGGGIMPWDGVPDIDLVQMNNFINTLPDY